MAAYLDEEEIWKCTMHPSKRRRRGVCPNCLKDRLASLCSDCATARPCSCSSASSAAVSSSSSSSFSRLSRVGSVGRVFNLIDSDSVLRRSRSLTIPIFRSKPENCSERNEFNGNGKRLSFWSVFKRKRRSDGEERDQGAESKIAEEERRRMMTKSRSVAVGVTSELDGGGMKSKSAAVKGRNWYFPSPIKAFRQSRISKLVSHVRSPLNRG